MSEVAEHKWSILDRGCEWRPWVVFVAGMVTALMMVGGGLVALQLSRPAIPLTCEHLDLDGKDYLLCR